MEHPLLNVMIAAARGTFPPVDGGVTLLPELPGGNRAIVALTGHSFIAAGLGPADFDDIALDGFGAALAPAALLRVADGGMIGVNDVTLVAPGTGVGINAPRTDAWNDHHRVHHARTLRGDVEVHGSKRGFVTIGSGLAGRREMSIELADTDGSSGLGRELIVDARGAVSADDFLFAAVSPGNARSLRSFLAAGFTPLGSETIIDRSNIAS